MVKVIAPVFAMPSAVLSPAVEAALSAAWRRLPETSRLAPWSGPAAFELEQALASARAPTARQAALEARRETVLAQCGGDLTNVEIARRLGVSPGTVQNDIVILRRAGLLPPGRTARTIGARHG